MARLVKCPYCEIQLKKEDAFEYKKKYYHEDCFVTWREEVNDRNKLIEYICELYGVDAPTGMILKQIKDFKEEFHYKYKGMELALQYFHETLGNSVQEGSGIGIVPFIYEDAKNYYIMQMKVKESIEENSGNFVKPKKVTVVSPKLEFNRQATSIDMASL